MIRHRCIHPTCSPCLCTHVPTPAEQRFRDEWPARCDPHSLAVLRSRCASGEAQRDVVALLLSVERQRAEEEDRERLERAARIAAARAARDRSRDRVSDEQIAAARDADLVDVIGARVKLRRMGNVFKGLCPLHQEKTPSFVVAPGKGWRCHGCGEGGDVIEFVMKLDGLTFLEAVVEIAGREEGRRERPRASPTPHQRRHGDPWGGHG